MAFTSEIIDYGNSGDVNVVRGRYINTGGDTGGVIPTGLRFVREMTFVIEGQATQLNPVIDDTTLPPNSPYLSDKDGNVTIITEPDSVGKWIARGF